MGIEMSTTFVFFPRKISLKSDLSRPLTADEARQLREEWMKKYGRGGADGRDEETDSDDDDVDDDDDDDSEYENDRRSR